MSEGSERLRSALSGRYAIERELGQGGMATVYLAQDLKHDRKVAVKVLRPELAAVIGADRFLAEIKTTANLQHPHILALFDSGTVNGTVFYVMPFVDGESLRDRLVREKQLPIADALRIATEVADALQYAHQHGIIHRDIKPENILLHGGHALVADFGIALAASKTGGTRMTETGMSLGTPQYMSPEQAMGERELDARTDIYALGCTTYEILTGEPPFTGPTAQAIVAKVMTAVPAEPATLRASIPPHVSDAVCIALQKLPADRFATAAEFAAALREGTTTGRRTTRSSATVAGRRRRPDLFISAIAIALGIAALWGWLRRPPAGAPSRQQVVLWRSSYPDFLVPSAARIETRVALSPDGGTIVFADSAGDDTQLFVKTRNESRATALAGTEGAAGPFMSADGQWVGYFGRGGAVRKVRVSGGGSVQLAANGNATYPVGTWLDDGSIIYLDAANAMARIPGDGGPGTTIRPSDVVHRSDPAELTALPGSRGILFTGCPGNCANGSAVYVFDLARNTTRLLVPDATGGWYSPTGHLVYTSRDGGLYAIGFDLKRMVATSGATAITDGVAPDGFVLSASGTALLVFGTQDLKKSTLVWVSRAGTEQPFAPDWTGNFEYPSLSPDGQNLAVSVRETVTQLWVRHADGSRLRISPGELGSWRPSWAADGRTFGFTTTDGATTTTGTNKAYQSPLDASTAPRPLLDLLHGIWEVEFSRDGEWLVVRTDDDQDFDVVKARRLHGDTTLHRIYSDSSSNRQLALSPDSRWLAFTSDRSGHAEVYVASFPDMQAQYPVSQGGGSEPRWAHSGRELFFKSHGKLMALPVAPGAGFAPGTALPLFAVGAYADAVNRPQYDVGADDQRFVMIRRPDRAPLQEVVLVENFFADLRAKVRR